MITTHAYYPIVLNSDRDLPNALFARILQLKTLSQEEQNFITSDFVTFSLETIEKEFKISNESVQEITLTIRKFYFKEISRQEVFALLDRNPVFAKHTQRDALYTFIDKNLLSYTIPAGYVERSFEDAEKVFDNKNITPLSLKKAIEKYPRIMNQRVTDADIVFRGSNGPSVPSVKNWITAYHQEMGSGQHEPFERSDFLFHNKSALLLSQNERNVLSEILRSLDEESDLPVNIDTQVVALGAIGERFTSANLASPRESASSPQEMQTAFPQSNPSLSRNIPPAERSVSSLYTKESVDDRRDAWHQIAPTEPVPSPLSKQIPSSAPPFSRGLSFTTHTSEEGTPSVGIPTSPPWQGEKMMKENTSSPSALRLEDSLRTSPPEYRGREEGRSTLPHPSAHHNEPIPSLVRKNERAEERPMEEKTFAPFTRGDLGIASRLGKNMPAQNTNSAPTLQRFHTASQPKPSSPAPPAPSTNPAISRVAFPSVPKPAPQEPLKTDRVDYTDYYPIPQESKSPKQNIQSNISFSSPHTFPVEQVPQEPVPTANTLSVQRPNPSPSRPPISSPLPPKQDLKTLTPSSPAQTTQQQKPKRRMIIG